MPYESVSGSPERASRVGHAEAAIRALADQREFFVPSDHLRNLPALSERVVRREDLVSPLERHLEAAIAIDGSRMAEPVREGLPSVIYGFAQAAAAYLDLRALESQRGARFVDPVALDRAVNSALVSLDLPCAGAYEREGVDISTSWREAVDRIFRAKRVEVNHLNVSLMELLFNLHGQPGAPPAELKVNCPHVDCDAKDIPLPAATPAAPEGRACPKCGAPVFLTDVLRIHEEGTNESALGRLMSVVELLVLVGLVTLLWEQHRRDLLPETLFLVDGPLAMYGPPAPLRSRALAYFQAMSGGNPQETPFLVGVEKTGVVVDFARKLQYHDVLKPRELLICDEHVIAAMTNTANPRGYGKETYWGRKFIYRTADGRVLVPTVVPLKGAPYDRQGGQPDPSAYPTLPAILDVFDRTGSSMYRDGIIPTALAHGKAAFPIGVGTDVLKLVARKRLHLDESRTDGVDR